MAYICDENGENCQYYPDEPSGSAESFSFMPEQSSQSSSQGYYDEITGQFIPTAGAGFPMLSNTSGTSPQFDANWKYDSAKKTWTDGQGKSYDLSYLNAPTGLGKLSEMLKGMGGKAMDFAGTPQGIMALLAAFAALKEKRGPSGGGATMGMQAPRQYTRTMTPGAYGPIARYAAEGGLMQAYAQGGTVQMEDGGFVLTKRAVDGAGGPMGIQQLVPGARMIRGPGTGTSDDIPAVINGQNGQTPARLSNGEAYVPRGAVQDQGGPKRMYALMNNLQRKA